MPRRRATLPRVRVVEKHLRRYNMARLLGYAPLRTRRGLIVGLVNMGENADEIWVEKTLPRADRQFTVLHERVHLRRQIAGEELADVAREEAYVELEAVARAPEGLLNSLPFPTLLVTIKQALTGGRLNPDRRGDLDEMYRRIDRLFMPRAVALSRRGS